MQLHICILQFFVSSFVVVNSNEQVQRGQNENIKKREISFDFDEGGGYPADGAIINSLNSVYQNDGFGFFGNENRRNFSDFSTLPSFNLLYPTARRTDGWIKNQQNNWLGVGAESMPMQISQDAVSVLTDDDRAILGDVNNYLNSIVMSGGSLSTFLDAIIEQVLNNLNFVAPNVAILLRNIIQFMKQTISCTDKESGSSFQKRYPTVPLLSPSVQSQSRLPMPFSLLPPTLMREPSSFLQTSKFPLSPNLSPFSPWMSQNGPSGLSPLTPQGPNVLSPFSQNPTSVFLPGIPRKGSDMKTPFLNYPQSGFPSHTPQKASNVLISSYSHYSASPSSPRIPPKGSDMGPPSPDYPAFPWLSKQGPNVVPSSPHYSLPSSFPQIPPKGSDMVPALPHYSQPASFPWIPPKGSNVIPSSPRYPHSPSLPLMSQKGSRVISSFQHYLTSPDSPQIPQQGSEIVPSNPDDPLSQFFPGILEKLSNIIPSSSRYPPSASIPWIPPKGSNMVPSSPHYPEPVSFPGIPPKISKVISSFQHYLTSPDSPQMPQQGSDMVPSNPDHPLSRFFPGILPKGSNIVPSSPTRYPPSASFPWIPPKKSSVMSSFLHYLTSPDSPQVPQQGSDMVPSNPDDPLSRSFPEILQKLFNIIPSSSRYPPSASFPWIPPKGSNMVPSSPYYSQPASFPGIPPKGSSVISSFLHYLTSPDSQKVSDLVPSFPTDYATSRSFPGIPPQGSDLIPSPPGYPKSSAFPWILPKGSDMGSPQYPPSASSPLMPPKKSSLISSFLHFLSPFSPEKESDVVPSFPQYPPSSSFPWIPPKGSPQYPPSASSPLTPPKRSSLISSFLHFLSPFSPEKGSDIVPSSPQYPPSSSFPWIPPKGSPYYSPSASSPPMPPKESSVISSFFHYLTSPFSPEKESDTVPSSPHYPPSASFPWIPPKGSDTVPSYPHYPPFGFLPNLNPRKVSNTKQPWKTPTSPYLKSQPQLPQSQSGLIKQTLLQSLLVPNANPIEPSLLPESRKLQPHTSLPLPFLNRPQLMSALLPLIRPFKNMFGTDLENCLDDFITDPLDWARNLLIHVMKLIPNFAVENQQLLEQISFSTPLELILFWIELPMRYGAYYMKDFIPFIFTILKIIFYIWDVFKIPFRLIMKALWLLAKPIFSYFHGILLKILYSKMYENNY